VTEGCEVYGKAHHSVLFEGVQIEPDAVVSSSIVFPYSKISRGAVLNRAIVSDHTVIGEGSVIGADEGIEEFLNDVCEGDVTLVGDNLFIGAGVSVKKNSMVDKNIMV
jgi:glucose-1-phosphate adenylyltransferase